MPAIDKIFTGKLNLDDSINLIEKFDYIDSLNITKDAVNGSQDLAVTNIVANRSVPYTLPAGTNQVIGARGDQLRDVMYYYVWNSNNYHSVLKYNNVTRSISKLIENLTDTANVDILGFNRYKKIIHIDIIHRDEGDLVYWVDTQNRPRKVNESTIQSFVPITADIINAAKNAPSAPLICSYQNDAGVNVNNLRKKLFQFAQSWVYKDLEESTLSPLCKVPLPVNGYDPDTTNDPTLNNNIKITVIGGGKDYQKIKLYGRELLGTTWSDYFLIDTFDRDDYSISTGASFIYYFYNDGVYPFQDVVRTTLLFDWLPDKSNAQVLANGNVLVYGGITEGYNNLARTDVHVTISSGLSTPSSPSIAFIYTSGNTIQITVGSTIVVGATYHVQFNYDTGGSGSGSRSVNYIAIGGDTQTSVRNALVALLNVAPIVSAAVGSGGGILNVIVSVGGGSAPTITNVIVTVSTSGAENAAASWNWYSKYRFALVYFNDLMKPLSIISFVGTSVDTNDFAVTTPDFSVVGGIIQVPFIDASINHTPPAGATTYQWLRTTNVTVDNFIYWITNDYQTDTNYLYFCIQNLTYNGTKNTGFVPSYDFKKGDHIRLMAKYAAGTITKYNLQLDFEIIGVEERTMTSPASLGRFIKVAKPITLPSLPYSANMIVELYTPSLRTSDNAQVFYEWGEKYNIYTSGGASYHRGQVTDQTAAQPATFHWFDGDVYFKSREMYLDVNSANTISEFTIDANYNDYFVSAVNSNGRAWPLNPDAKVQYFPTLIRFGQAYQPDTNINGLNRFYSDNFYDKCNRSYGDILKLSVKGSYIHVGQKFKIGNIPVLLQIVKDSNSQDILATSDQLLNQIIYFQGDYGVGNTPESWTDYNFASYFTYSTRGIVCRLSQDGIIPISVLYKVNSWATDNLPLRDGDYKVYGTYDPKSNNYIMALEAAPVITAMVVSFEAKITSGIFNNKYVFSLKNTANAGDTVTVTLTDGNGITKTYSYTAIAGNSLNTIVSAISILINADIYFHSVVQSVFATTGLAITQITTNNPTLFVGSTTIRYSAASASPAQTLTFDEETNQFESFLSYNPEMMVTLGDLLITFKNGGMWTHDSPSEFNNFYGVAYESYITAPFNSGVRQKKTWTVISQISNTIWDCPTIYTNALSYGNQRQESSLGEYDFTMLEGNPSASILRDVNSQNGILNGDSMKGTMVVIKFRKSVANNLISLVEASVNYIDSPLTSN